MLEFDTFPDPFILFNPEAGTPNVELPDPFIPFNPEAGTPSVELPDPFIPFNPLDVDLARLEAGAPNLELGPLLEEFFEECFDFGSSNPETGPSDSEGMGYAQVITEVDGVLYTDASLRQVYATVGDEAK